MFTIDPENTMEKYLCDKAFAQHIPLSGTFELLPICNMDCKMCYIRMSPEEMRRQGEVLSAKEWIGFGRQMVKEGMMFLLLTGGEPLLHPEFFDIYHALRNMGICVTINTNGTLITEKTAEEFQKNPPRRVNVSLYGASDETYARLCGNPQGFSQTMRGIRLLLEAGIAVKVNFVPTLHNKEDLEEVIRITEEWNIPVSTPTYIFPPVRKDENAEMDKRMSPEEVADLQMSIIHRNHHMEVDYADHLREILEKVQKKEKLCNRVPVPGGFLCSAGVSSFWVNWKGHATPCGMMPELAEDLRKVPFAKAWKRIMEKSSGIYTSEDCFNCNYRSICQTCAASAHAETGSYDGVPEYHCEICKNYERKLQEELKKNIMDSDGGMV